MKSNIITDVPENTPKNLNEFNSRCSEIEEELGQVYERINENNKHFAMKCFEFIRDCNLLTAEYAEMLSDKVECTRYFDCDMNPFEEGGVLSRVRKIGDREFENIIDSKNCQRYFKLEEITVQVGEAKYNVSNFWFSEYTPTGRRRNRPTKTAFFNKVREDAYNICFRDEAEAMRIEKIKILFVGYNNVLRSPMAEYVMKHMVEQAGLSDKVSITSSGYGKKFNFPVSEYTKYELDKHAIPYDEKLKLQFTKADFNYNYIIAMDNYDAKKVAKILGKEHKDRIFLLLDFAGEHKDIQYVYNMYEDIERGCQALMEKVREHFNI